MGFSPSLAFSFILIKLRQQKWRNLVFPEIAPEMQPSTKKTIWRLYASG